MLECQGSAWRAVTCLVCVQQRTSLPRSTVKVHEHCSTTHGVMVTPPPALLVGSPVGS